MTDEQQPLTLLVTLQFQDLSTRNEFFEDIRPTMEYIRLHELTCLGFEMFLSDKKEDEGDDHGLQVLLLERYSGKDIFKFINQVPPFRHFDRSSKRCNRQDASHCRKSPFTIPVLGLWDEQSSHKQEMHISFAKRDNSQTVAV
jgi:hypothetical protein